MKKITTLFLITGLLCLSSCQLSGDIEEIFPGFVMEEGKLYEVSGKAPYTGELTDYYDDGTIKMEAFYKEGVRQSATHFYPNGNKESRHVRTDDDWEMILWYESGQKKEKFAPGVIREWYENGRLKAEISTDDFRNYHGDMKMWDEEGNLLVHEIYEEGELVETVKND